MAEKNKTISAKEKVIVETEKRSGGCTDRNCHIHGNLKVRGRTFEGRVIKKFAKN